MIDTFVTTLEAFPRGLAYVALGVVSLYLAKWILDLLTPYRVSDQIGEQSNTAVGLSVTGYLLGVIIVFVAALYTPNGGGEADWTLDVEFGFDLLEVFLYTLGAVAVLNLSRLVVDHLVLYKFKVEKEIVEDRNIGTGIVEMGVYLAVSLVIAASLSGYESGPLVSADPTLFEEIARSVVFFLLGMVVLVVYALFYQLTTAYDIHEEFEKNNIAVGVTMAANLIAIAVVTFKAVSGEFVSWSESLIGFAIYAVIGFALLLIVRWIIDKAIFPRVVIADELSKSQNVGIAFVVGGIVISAALILYFAI